MAPPIPQAAALRRRPICGGYGVGAATAGAPGEDAEARCEFLPPASDVRVDGAEKLDEDDDLNRVNRITRYPNSNFWIPKILDIPFSVQFRVAILITQTFDYPNYSNAQA